VTRTLLIAVAVLSVAAGAANARVHHRNAHHARHIAVHHAPPAMMSVPTSAYPGPRPLGAAPQSCWIDEGYGRFFPCGGGPSVP